jgi:hypothetical protein
MELSVAAVVRRSGGHCLPPSLSYGLLELVGGDVRNLVHFLLHHSLGNRRISRNTIVDLTFRWRSKKNITGGQFLKERATKPAQSVCEE